MLMFDENCCRVTRSINGYFLPQDRKMADNENFWPSRCQEFQPIPKRIVREKPADVGDVFVLLHRKSGVLQFTGELVEVLHSERRMRFSSRRKRLLNSDM